MTYPIERVQRFPVSLPNPPVGTEFALTPTGRGAWRILSLVATLATSAVVANRGVAWTVDDTNGTFFRSPAGAVQINGATVKYAAFDGASVTGLIGTNIAIGWPNGGIVLYEGYRLRSITDNLDAGDQWSAIAALVEELPTGRLALVTPVNEYQVEPW